MPVVGTIGPRPFILQGRRQRIGRQSERYGNRPISAGNSSCWGVAPAGGSTRMSLAVRIHLGSRKICEVLPPPWDSFASGSPFFMRSGQPRRRCGRSARQLSGLAHGGLAHGGLAHGDSPDLIWPSLMSVVDGRRAGVLNCRDESVLPTPLPDESSGHSHIRPGGAVGRGGGAFPRFSATGGNRRPHRIASQLAGIPARFCSG
jgi:hypothetical protein